MLCMTLFDSMISFRQAQPGLLKLRSQPKRDQLTNPRRASERSFFRQLAIAVYVPTPIYGPHKSEPDSTTVSALQADPHVHFWPSHSLHQLFLNHRSHKAMRLVPDSGTPDNYVVTRT